MTCPRCTSCRLVRFIAQNHWRVETRWRCLACWWSSADWKEGHLQRLTTGLEYERKGLAVRND